MDVTASHNSVASQQVSSVYTGQSYEEPGTSTRLPLALHVPYLPRYSPFAGQSSNLTLSGAGYGPPLLQNLSPVQKTVKEVVDLGTEYDLVTLPLANEHWKVGCFAAASSWAGLLNQNAQERWERMCLLSEDVTQTSAQRQPRTSNRPSMDNTDRTSTGTQGTGFEAELWRAGGGFKRTEVNMTRAGASPVEKVTLFLAHLVCIF